jgi:nicotinamide-nucleotide amidase
LGLCVLCVLVVNILFQESMKAEIISVGSELTSGQNLDTNSQWLSQRLAEIGIAVGWHTTVADDLEDNVAAFRIAAERAGLVLITGGLGPTQDDLTREALAQMAGVELVFHAPSFEHIQQLFARRHRTMPERNRVQAMFPAGSEPIPNPHGTAPGIWMNLRPGGSGGVVRRQESGVGSQESASSSLTPDSCLLTPAGDHSPLTTHDTLLVAMPGVPSEMFAMFEKQVRPRLLAMGFFGGVVVQRKINCFGAGESAIEEKLMDLTRRGQSPEVGITASDATISLRILARANTAEEAKTQIEPAEKAIRERLGSFIFGVDGEELQDAVVAMLKARQQTVATAESVTAGLVARRLGLVPGASACLLGGVVAYDARIKVELLGVPPSLIEEHGVISAPVVEAMAVGCRSRFRSDFAVSTVGLAGPGGGSPEKPIGMAFAGLAWDGGVRSQSFNWLGTREEIQSRTAKMALNLLRLHLLTK